MTDKSIPFSPFVVKLHHEVYEPAEDTYLLLDNLPDLSEKTFLEIGAGTGVISLFAALTAQKVVCTDINPFAVELIQENINLNRKHLKTIPEVRQGTLFSPILPTEKFDVIAFNPPYLPLDQYHEQDRKPKSKMWLEKSWDGGETGIEITMSFFDHVGEHLSPGGLIYLISSSLSGVQTVISQANAKNLRLEVCASLEFPFETLSLLFGGRTKRETAP